LHDLCLLYRFFAERTIQWEDERDDGKEASFFLGKKKDAKKNLLG